MLRVPGALARGKRGKHAERFELHDVMVQIQLHIAAPVGALADRVYLAADRQPLAEIFRRDFAPRRIDAELQACPERQVPRADLLGAEPQPLVRERRLAPEGQNAAGRIFSGHSAGEGDPGRSAAAKRADAPGGRLYGLRIAVCQNMLRRQLPVRRKAQDERLFKAGPGIGSLPQADAVREQLAGDRRVVRIIRPAALRRGPEAVPAVNPPALLRLQPVGQILRLAVKQIRLPRAAQMYDSDAEIQRGGSLRPAVRQPDQIAELSSGARQAARRPRWLKTRSRM